MKVLFINIWLLLLLKITNCKNEMPIANQLLTPIKYMFQKLQAKADMNPLLYRQTIFQNKCSSDIGPYCSCIFSNKFQKTKIILDQQAQLVRQLMHKNVEISAKTMAKIQTEGLNVLLLSSDWVKNVDKFMSKIIQENIMNRLNQMKKKRQIK